MNDLQKKGLETLYNRALKQDKINSFDDMRIEFNKFGAMLVSWRSKKNKHIFRFTIFKDGTFAIGFYGI